jgi:hypothetical protein
MGSISPSTIYIATRIIIALISSGKKKSNARRHADTVTVVLPSVVPRSCRPPSRIPAVDSMQVLTVVLPSAALGTVYPAVDAERALEPAGDDPDVSKVGELGLEALVEQKLLDLTSRWSTGGWRSWCRKASAATAARVTR